MAESEQGTFPVGTHLGAYVLDHCVGSGAMGEVYQGHHSGLGKRVAIKLLQRHVANNASIRTRFLREGKTASLLQHPHVVQVTDVGEEEGTPYLVMEYLEGEPLSRMLKREHRQEIEPLVDLMLPIIDAVSLAHAKGVIHRDLKPDNVFLTVTRSGEYHPKVLDFGISKILNDCSDPMLTGTQAVLGTPHYMAPEQALQGRDVDGRADQYSLGVMLYEGVTGQTPHHDTDSLARLVVAISTGQFQPPSTIRPDLPRDFEAIIMRAMARQPEDRFPSVAALGAALLPFASERGRAAWEPVFLGGNTAPGGSASVRGVSSVRSPARSTAPGTKSPTTAGGGAVTATAVPLGKRGTVSASLIGLGIAVLLVTVLVLRGVKGAATPPLTYQVDVTVEPATALVQIDSRSLGHGHVREALARDGTSHSLLVSANGYDPQSLAFRDEPPPSHIVLSPAAAGDKTAQPPLPIAQKSDPQPREVPQTKAREVPQAKAPSKKGARPAVASPTPAEPAPSAAPSPPPAQEDSDWGSPRKRTDNKNPWGE